MKKKLSTLIFALLVFSIPLLSIVNGQPLTDVLRDLRSELKMVCDQSAESQQLFDKDYEMQHQKMMDVITASNELSILLYTQEQEMSFDLAYALNGNWEPNTTDNSRLAFKNERLGTGNRLPHLRNLQRFLHLPRHPLGHVQIRHRRLPDYRESGHR